MGQPRNQRVLVHDPVFKGTSHSSFRLVVLGTRQRFRTNGMKPADHAPIAYVHDTPAQLKNKQSPKAAKMHCIQGLRNCVSCTKKMATNGHLIHFFN